MHKKEAPKDEAAVPAPDAAAAVEPQAVKDEIAAKEKLAQDYFQQLLRLKAEFENFRKRVDKERPELIRYGRAEVLSKLLPLYDVMAQFHEEVQRRHAAESAPEGMKPLVQGLELIFKEFEKLFAAEGLKPIEALGKRYDPEWHDVVGTVEGSDVEDGAVVDVLQPGFMLDGKVLRHAKVRISKKPAEAKNDAKPA